METRLDEGVAKHAEILAKYSETTTDLRYVQIQHDARMVHGGYGSDRGGETMKMVDLLIEEINHQARFVNARHKLAADEFIIWNREKQRLLHVVKEAEIEPENMNVDLHDLFLESKNQESSDDRLVSRALEFIEAEYQRNGKHGGRELYGFIHSLFNRVDSILALKLEAK